MESNTSKFWTIPNIITLSRIVMIPIFIWAFLADQWIIALVTVILSGISDKADGVIARKFNMVSDSGKWLDPMADKFTQIALAILFWYVFWSAQEPMMNAFAWVFLVFVGKELFMLLFALFMLAIGKRPAAAEIWGKIATTAFYIVMSLLIFVGPEVGIISRWWELPMWSVQILVWVTIALTVLSFLSYIPDTYRKVVKGEN